VSRVRDGFIASLALVPSVFVYATVFGGLAVQAGLHPVEVWGMSVLVLAGASQFVAVPMIAAGAVAIALAVPGNWHIVIAGLVVSAAGALVLAPEQAPRGPTCGSRSPRWRSRRT
jgi:predicted branched-subunit amino acid permease